jgi:hypothetical protein
MNTTGKVVIGAALLFVGAKMFGKKKDSTASNPALTEPTQRNLEGRWIQQDNGNHFIILNGKRWFTTTVQSIIDFQKQYPGNGNVESGFTEEDLAAYPIAGGIYENLELVTNGSKPKGTIEQTQDVLRRLGAPEMCVKQNTDGSSTYYSSHGGNRPCPYGGRIAVQKITKLTPAAGTFNGMGNPIFLGV